MSHARMFVLGANFAMLSQARSNIEIVCIVCMITLRQSATAKARSCGIAASISPSTALTMIAVSVAVEPWKPRSMSLEHNCCDQDDYASRFRKRRRSIGTVMNNLGSKGCFA
jgi:hypothetical protein